MKLSKFNEIGRSMVEMLGVLAIIGVLSVGAIAGYSKAMMKYKLNKHAESYRLLLYETMNMSKQIDPSKLTENLDLLPLLEKTNSIPSGYSNMIKYDNYYIYDIFGNATWVGIVAGGRGYIGTDFTPSAEGYEICRNLVNVAIENSEHIYYLHTDKKTLEDGEPSYSDLAGYYGDTVCTTQSWMKCLKNITLEDTKAICNNCDSVSCRLYINFVN